MKLLNRSVLLKIMASAAVSGFVYAGTVTLRTALFDMDGGLIALLLFILITLLGYAAGGLFLGNTPIFLLRIAGLKLVRVLSFMLHIKYSARYIASLAAWVIILIPLLVSLLIYRQYGIWRLLFELLLATVSYFMSLKRSRLTSTQILHSTAVCNGFIILAVCLEASYFASGLAYLRPWLYAATYFFILIYLIIKNQEDIDSNIFDKKHVEKSMLPKNLRRFNVLSVCVIFLAIILSFNLKPIVIYILKLLGNLTIFIMKIVLWILAHIFPSQGTAQQEGSKAEMPGFFGKETEIINPYGNLLANIIKYFIILYITYRILLSLSRILPGLVHRIIEWIKKLLSIHKGDKYFQEGDYSDETVTVKPIREHYSQRNLKNKMRKNWRDLRKISDPVERVRHMYSSILNMLPSLGVHPDKCDTTLEIVGKTTSSGEVSKELLPFTAIYNQVRYGDKVPDTGMLTEAIGRYDRMVEVIRQK